MAVKKKLENGYTYEDLFDTTDALDQGILGSVDVGTKTWSKSQSFLGIPGSSAGGTSRLMANKDNIGSILGMTTQIEANKKRRKEQSATAGAGFGASGSSVLGGGPF